MASKQDSANKQDSAEQSAAVQPQKARKLLMIGIALGLIAAAGAAAWHFTREDGTAHAEVESAKPPIFVPLDVFTVNLADTDQYLQAGLTFSVTDSAVIESVKLHGPEIRNRILLLLSSKRASELSTVEGKQKLADEIVAATRESLPANGPDKGVRSVLFTSFVIQ